MYLKCESGSSHFQLGEGPSRGLLRDYEPSDGPSFQALALTQPLLRGARRVSMLQMYKSANRILVVPPKYDE